MPLKGSNIENNGISSTIVNWMNNFLVFVVALYLFLK